MATMDPRLAGAFQDRYRLEREIGAGGMATVYLAQDLKHDRKVAIKVLHPELAAALGADRFLAEIRVTANLQHPHILPLHDSGAVYARHPDDVPRAERGDTEGPALLFYVMPYIPGESLRDRLQRERQLPVPDAVAIARDVAAALDYAHRQGVIHRDIKPENILLHEGRPVVADFGIALAVSAAGGVRMTQTGLSLGTPHYMSPEQAMGERSIDARTDVYASGCVLYEMLTGEPPFTGATTQAILAKVLTERPVPPSTVRDTVPPHVEDAVLTALAKLPADRFATASAFGAALAAQPTSPNLTSVGRRPAPVPIPWWRRAPAAVTALAAMGVVTAVALVMAMRGAPDGAGAAPVMRFEVPLPDSLAIRKVVLTPDGTRLLLSTDHGPFEYTFADARLAPLEIPGGASVQDVDITPDGTTLVFRERRVLKTMPVGGGAIRTVADSARSVRVGDDGYVYSSAQRGVRRVALATGAVETLLMRDSAQLALDSLFGDIGEPMPIPGGRGVVFAVSTYAPAATRLAVLDLQTREVRRVPHPEMQTAVPVGFSPSGHLLFRGPDAVYAIRFDTKELRADGTAERVVGNLPVQNLSCDAMACSGEAFNEHALAFVAAPMQTLAIVNQRGEWRSLPNIPPRLAVHGAVASPDGRMLALQAQDLTANRQDIWTYRLPSGPLTRLTSSPAGFHWAPGWTRDGMNIRYSMVTKDDEGLFTIPRDGSQPPELLLSRIGGFGWSIAYHPDGRRVATNACLTIAAAGEACGPGGSRLLVLSIAAPDSAAPVDGANVEARYGVFSPEGRYIAYLAREVDRNELYVRPLNGSRARWQVSRTGAGLPRWSRDGRTIFFLANDSMFAAEWTADAEQPVGAVRALFRLGTLGGAYDVLPGDSTFVMIAPNDQERTRVIVIANFARQLK